MTDQPLLDDGLLMPEVGAWCEDKYKLVGHYLKLFATGMKFKWENRVYIDLYSGAGISRIRGTKKLVMGSPLRALNMRDPFDLYIFCDSDESKLQALKHRTQANARGLNIKYVLGDCNAMVERICSLIPSASSSNKVLSLCFADPYDIGIKFSTVKTLSSRYVDFLVLLAVYMDASRAYIHHLKQENKKVDEF
jgi:three-Cys-motif partner protein